MVIKVSKFIKAFKSLTVKKASYEKANPGIQSSSGKHFMAG